MRLSTARGLPSRRYGEASESRAAAAIARKRGSSASSETKGTEMRCRAPARPGKTSGEVRFERSSSHSDGRRTQFVISKRLARCLSREVIVCLGHIGDQRRPCTQLKYEGPHVAGLRDRSTFFSS